MPSKTIRKKHELYNLKGGLLNTIVDPDGNNKEYAVIAKCGHCELGYFIPIMFLQYAKDAKLAAEATRINGFVKHDDKDCILDVVELHGLEYTFIENANRGDPFLNGYITKDDDAMINRQVADDPNIDYYKNNPTITPPTQNIKTADAYYPVQTLEKAYAPIFDGNKYIYPRNLNAKQLLHDFIREKTFMRGVIKGDISYLSLYYQMYGENNELGIKLKDNKFYCFAKNTRKVYEIPQVYLNHIKESGILEKDANPKTTEPEITYKNVIESPTDKKRPSQVDKFKARLAKVKQNNPEESSMER